MDNRRFLAELMEAVEDISADAIMDGLPWNWTSYGGYLDAVQALRPALNVVGMVGHSPVRVEAMGDKSMDEGVQASDEELKEIARLVHESVAEGAVGFSTSRILMHRVPDGRSTPGTWANAREMETIQHAALDAGGAGTVFQVVPDLWTRRESELQMIERAAELGCRVLMVCGATFDGDGWDVGTFGEFLARNNSDGRRMASICQARPGGVLFGLYSFLGFATPAWRQLRKLPTMADRLEALRHAATRKRLIDEAKQSGFMFGFAPEKIHPLGTDERPVYDLDCTASLAHLAERDGKDAVDLYVERLIASEGRELFHGWGSEVPTEQWRYLQDQHCIPMLGDAGAHVTMIMDADSPTIMRARVGGRSSVAFGGQGGA